MQLLPAERVLCELFDVSRTTLAQGDRRPCPEGVLLHRHGARHLHSSCEAARRSALVAPDELYGRHAAARLRRVRANSRRGVFLPTPEEAMMLGAGPNETRVPARPLAAR